MTEPANPSESDRTPQPDDGGRLIAGRYRLGEVVGRGGMATIYRAEDTQLHRVVALKLLRPEISADRDLADRFRREALATTVLRHRNIVGCLDTGADPAGPFMVMEMIEGEDLAAHLRQSGAMPPWDVARIGLDVARGLGVAHMRGIVHRDVKPSNILLARDGRAMITDFGIARLAADAEATLPGTTLGSVQYFSPEQAQGASTTPASDVYGLGLVMYEALTGRRPWAGDTPGQIALARVGAQAPSPRDVRPDVPLELDAVVTRALAAEPLDRYPSGTALASALEPLVVASEPSSPVPPRRSRTLATDRTTATPIERLSPGLRAARRAPALRPARGPLRSLAVLAVLALVVGGFAMVVLGADEDGGLADVTARPTRTPKPTAKPAQATPVPTAGATARPTATPTPKPTPKPKPTATQPPILASDVCEPFFEVACSLGAGLYAPARFSPPVGFRVGDGWSTALDARELLVLARDTGRLIFASDVGPVDGTPRKGFGKGTARDIVAAFAKTHGLKAAKQATLHIDGHEGRSVDVTPKGSDRQAVFTAGDRVYVLAPDRTTRLVAIDTDEGPLILVIEPSDGHTLREILDTADDVAGTIRFR